MHRVSIGLPVYNGERYIAETLDSLLAQTYEDFEIVICDNASIDKTEQICRSYVRRDPRIRYTRNKENLGAAKNYRRAFELSSGEYFRWANSDDLFAPEGLARCVEILDREPSVVLVYPKTRLIDERGQVISDYEDGLHLQSPRASERFVQLHQRLGLVNVIYGLIRSNMLRKTGLLRNFPGGDIPLVSELTLYGKFWEIPEVLFYRRIHPGAYSSLKHDTLQSQEFFDPKNQVPLTKWRHWYENFKAVKRASLNVPEKIRLYLHIVRMGVWIRDQLFEELHLVMRRQFRKL